MDGTVLFVVGIIIISFAINLFVDDTMIPSINELVFFTKERERVDVSFTIKISSWYNDEQWKEWWSLFFCFEIRKDVYLVIIEWSSFLCKNRKVTIVLRNFFEFLSMEWVSSICSINYSMLLILYVFWWFRHGNCWIIRCSHNTVQ